MCEDVRSVAHLRHLSKIYAGDEDLAYISCGWAAIHSAQALRRIAQRILDEFRETGAD